jgi:uncharacterized damage-inducible protein DinB
MDLLDRFLGHDAATTRELFALCRPLTDEQLDRPLGIDHGTLRDTCAHLVTVMEIWTDFILGQPVRWEALPRGAARSIAELSERFEAVARDFAAHAARIQAEGRWDDTFVDVRQGRRKTLGAGIAHVLTHNMAHRTHAFAMLDRLGVADVPEGDVLGWERRLRGGWEAVT